MVHSPRRSPLLAFLLFALLALPAATPLRGQALSMPPGEAAPSLATREAAPPPLRLAERFGVAPMAVLSEATAGAGDQLAAMRAWNDSGRQPTQAGIVRPLPLAERVILAPGAMASAGHHAGGVFLKAGGDRLVWAAEVAVREAAGIKLHLRDAELPPDARLWVYGESGEARGPVTRDAVVDGELWTPVVQGGAIRIEVEVPAAGPEARFTIDSLAQIVLSPFTGGTVGSKVDVSCLANADCVSPFDLPIIDLMQSATALYFVVTEGRLSLCTGGLLNSASGSPFFLTANHCVSTRAAAASADFFWDYFQVCDGDLNDYLYSSRADLLATDPSSDFSLLELDAVPGGRGLFGWDGGAGALAPGPTYYRVSHPVGDDAVFPQGFSAHQVLPSPVTCSASGFGAPPLSDLTRFAYSNTVAGGVLNGSSGAPLVTADGFVVGQLFGACGPNPAEGCDRANQIIDGRFSNTFGIIGSYLNDPEGDGFVPPPAGPWLRSAALPGFEAKVLISSAAAVPGAVEGDCIPQTLCASGALAGRPEVFVKVIGPRPNGFLWTQLSRFSPSKTEVWLRQIASGEINYYLLDAVPNSADDVSGLVDREAFLP